MYVLNQNDRETVVCQFCGRKKELNQSCPFCGKSDIETKTYQKPTPYSLPQYPPSSPYNNFAPPKRKSFLNKQVEALGNLMGNIWTYIFILFYFGILIFVSLDENLFVTLVSWYSLMSYAAIFFLLAGAIPILFTAWIMQNKQYSLPKIDNGLVQGLFGFVCVFIPLLNTYVYHLYDDQFISLEVNMFCGIFISLFLILTLLSLYIFSKRAHFELRSNIIIALIFFCTIMLLIPTILDTYSLSFNILGYEISQKSMVMISFFILLLPTLAYSYLYGHKHVGTIILSSALFLGSIFIYNLYWLDIGDYDTIYQILFRLLVFGIVDVVILYLINISTDHGRKEVGIAADSSQLSNYILLGIATPFYVYFIALIAFSVAGASLANITLEEFVVVFTISFILAAFFEEFSFRGFIQTRLENGLGTWPGLILASIIFGLAHLPTQIVSSGSAFVGFGLTFSQTLGGLMLGYLYKRTRSLIPCVISHGMWNFALFITVVAI